MKKSIFKYPKYENEKHYKKCKVFWVVCEEVIQQWAQDQIDRNLTEKELFRLHDLFYEEEIITELEHAVKEVICDSVIDPTGWSETDKLFEKDIKPEKFKVKIDIK